MGAQVIGKDEFHEATQPKVDRYTPLAGMMRTRLGPQSRVEVVPVIVGSCSVPPPNWSGVCARLRVECSLVQMWKQVQQILIEYVHKIFWAWSELGNVNGSNYNAVHCWLHTGWLYVT